MVVPHGIEPWPPGLHSGALPTELQNHELVERPAGLEPAPAAWEADVLPLTLRPLGGVPGTRTRRTLPARESCALRVPHDPRDHHRRVSGASARHHQQRLSRGANPLHRIVTRFRDSLCGPGRIRTDNRLLAKQLLYRWSYKPMKLAPARGARPPGGTGHQRARHLRIPRLPLARRTNDSFNGWSHAQVAWWNGGGRGS